MPKATVTVRDLRNKDTGVDLSVTSYKETPGLVRSTFEFQIVVVSSLSCFKLPSHKESDVVQFTLFKKFADFEELRGKLNEAFSGTVFPPLVKKSIIVNEAVIKERRNSLDNFLRFLASTPRVITCSHVLAFLGVDAQRAKRFASGETEGSAQPDGGKGQEKDEESTQEGMTSSNLFEEEEEEDGEDFLSETTGSSTRVQDDDDFFSTSDSHRTATRDTSLFESQDLKRELTEEDEKEFAFIPDAIITKRETVSMAIEDTENDLLQVDEDIDLDKLLTLETNSKQKQPPPPTHPSKPQPSPKPSLPTKPSVKPKPAAKPAVPGTAKPAVPTKPGAGGASAATKSPEKQPGNRPVPAPRRLKPAATKSGESSDGQGEQSRSGGSGDIVSSPSASKVDMSSDDIMQYIADAANVEDPDADLDLFS